MGSVKGRDKESADRSCASATTAILACEACQFCWGAQTSKGAREGGESARRLGREQREGYYFSRRFAARSHGLLQLRHSVLRPTKPPCYAGYCNTILSQCGRYISHSAAEKRGKDRAWVFVCNLWQKKRGQILTS